MRERTKKRKKKKRRRKRIISYLYCFIMMHYTIADITNTTYFKLLSCDLMENIWWLVCEYYAKIIQKYFKKYITFTVKKICHHINKYEYYFGITAFHYLWTHNFDVLIDKKVYNKKTLFTCFNACNCCAEHQIDKPNHMHDYSVLTAKIENNYVICPCKCRHINKKICNANKYFNSKITAI